MSWRTKALREWFNAWLLGVGKWRAILAIAMVSMILSVLLTWMSNVIFMPDEPLEDWLYVSIIVPALIAPPVSSVVLSLLYQLAEARAALVTMSETDPLTGVGNRRHFMEQAQRAIAAAKTMQVPLSIVLIDIDHFKRVNDTHGHAVGDEVIVRVASACRQKLRSGDVFCRWGGEEFIVLLPSASLEMGCQLAERLRVAVAESAAPEAPVTISLGVGELTSQAGTLDEVVSVADHQLYRAKDGGRNRVEPSEGLAAATAARTLQACEGQETDLRLPGSYPMVGFRPS